MHIRIVVAALALALVIALPARSQTTAADLLAQLEPSVTQFTLDNGLTFIVVERRDAPVVSFFTYADVGSVNEPVGQTGIAHMFEHMAFKGSTQIGTSDIRAELDALRLEEEAAQALFRERARGAAASPARIAELEAALARASEYANSYVDTDNTFDAILERAGIVGMNAFTSADATGYLSSLPANRLELWFALESDRFLNPVLREFYTERNVVMEERRQRTDSSPIGRLIEEYIASAFKAHPYGQPVVGHMSDLQNITRTQALEFFRNYYSPNNLTIGIVGDVDTAEVRRLAHRYFGPIPRGEAPPPVTTVEPAQIGERRVTIIEQSQPFVVMGFHRPNAYHDDAPVYRVLSDVLGTGRTSRFYRGLVEQQRAVGTQVLQAFPGDKYPTLFTILGIPSQGVDPADLENEMWSELQRIAEDGITTEELARAQARARSAAVSQLDGNMNLASGLTTNLALTGDWRRSFRDLDALSRVTTADVQRVAAELFRESNRTVATLRTSAQTATN